ncbi:MAG: hypothetical protein ACK2UQ_07260 [Anaerolineae bacterium]
MFVMKRVSSQTIISYIAVAQFVPFLLFPWDISPSSLIFVIILLALSAFLGWALWSHKPWGRMLTIFTQGFNIIVRIITFFSNVYTAENGLNWVLLITYVLSIGLSWIILSYIDKPEIQLVFES